MNRDTDLNNLIQREDESDLKEWTIDSDLNNLIQREDESDKKEWKNDSDLNNLRNGEIIKEWN
jgi:hypothetical protein